VPSQIQQDGDHSTPKKPLRKGARPFTKVRFVYPVDETAHSQVPFTLLTGVQPSKPIDQYHSAPGISPSNQASQLQMPITPLPDLLTVAMPVAPVTPLPEIYSGMPNSSTARIQNISTKKKIIAPLPPNQRLLTTPHSLSVILPAYNEEALIAYTISTILLALSTWMQDFEVIVVNDGSKDRTGEIVADLATYDQRIRLINHPIHSGYGAALISGFESVTKELAFFMDSDGQFDIGDLAHFLPLIQEYDAVLGYRIDRQDTWMRKLNTWGWKQLVRFIFGIHVRDIDCAFKLFRAEFFRTHRLETRGAMINAEIVYKLVRAGYTYTEVGVHHLPRRAVKATEANLTVIVRALYEMFMFAHKWQQDKQPSSYSSVIRT